MSMSSFDFIFVMVTYFEIYIIYVISSARSASPSLDELKYFSRHLERRMSRLIMVKNSGILPMSEGFMESESPCQVIFERSEY